MLEPVLNNSVIKPNFQGRTDLLKTLSKTHIKIMKKQFNNKKKGTNIK